MFSWFKRLFSKPGVPPELQRMLAITIEHEDHPLVKHHLRQVSIIDLYSSDGQSVRLFLPEFRDGLYAALLWDDARGTWGSGGWIPVAHEDADVTCEPSHFNWDYMIDTPGFPTSKAVMDYLFETRPSAPTS